MIPACLTSATTLRSEFIAGLDRMLAEPELGAFVLVLANAVYDPAIHAELETKLWRRFDEHAANYRELLRNARPLPDAPDDVLVFLKLMAVGRDGVSFNQARLAGPWQVQFNQVRAFRPPRMANAVVTELHKPFQADRFHFNKPFLRKEILWDGDLLGRQVRLLYNKFPFAPLHGLLVIDPERNHPQFLRAEDHGYLWRMLSELGEGMPGIGLGYNAYGAFASVNHQHLQSYVRDQDNYPIEDDLWSHNGGGRDYPVSCQRFDDRDDAWAAIAELHGTNRTYNLLYRPGRLYLTQRAFQGSYQHAPWTGGFAWSELAGSVTTFNREDFERLDDELISAELAKLVG